ncbi:MAG: glycosyltransferase [bacterium]
MARRSLKIVGITCVYNEARKYLKEVLIEKSKLCDKIIVLGDSPTDETKEICEKFSKVEYRETKERLFNTHQWLLKELALKYASYKKPDWILAFDADELFEKRVNRKVLEELAFKGHNSYYFRFVHLWDDREHIRVDRGWDKLYKVIFYKFQPDQEQKFAKKALHCGLAPLYAHQKPRPEVSGYIVKHLGYMKPEDRKKKFLRYNRFDSSGFYKPKWWYNSIIEKGKIIPFEENYGYQDDQMRQSKRS